VDECKPLPSLSFTPHVTHGLSAAASAAILSRLTLPVVRGLHPFTFRLCGTGVTGVHLWDA